MPPKLFIPPDEPEIPSQIQQFIDFWNRLSPTYFLDKSSPDFQRIVNLLVHRQKSDPLFSQLKTTLKPLMGQISLLDFLRGNKPTTSSIKTSLQSSDDLADLIRHEYDRVFGLSVQLNGKAEKIFSQAAEKCREFQKANNQRFWKPPTNADLARYLVDSIRKSRWTEEELFKVNPRFLLFDDTYMFYLPNLLTQEKIWKPLRLKGLSPLDFRVLAETEDDSAYRHILKTIH